jgi:secernin
MCDTAVATGKATIDGVTIFGKNSDREPNEGHHLLHLPATDHAEDSKLHCTYIEIPQVAHTYAVTLAKPFWIWGAEMGTNEYGVAIGNEAVFTKVPYQKEGGLIGMDLLRLGLERAKSAYETLIIITDLLAQYGQGGNCGFHKKLYYHNSFIIADPQEAWVLETAGEHWAAQRIVDSVYTISNGITIGSDWDLASPGLVNHAIERGWCKKRDDFHFARCYSDFIYTRFSYCRNRRDHTSAALSSDKVTVQQMIQTLRDHQGDVPGQGLFGADVCMHAGFGPIRGSQTVGSMVSLLHQDNPVHFFTATAAPCTSIFKPVWTHIPDTGPEPKGEADGESLFWRHELLHRETLRDYPTRVATYAEERDQMEANFIKRAFEHLSADDEKKNACSEQCFAEADTALARWTGKVKQMPIQKGAGFLYRQAWKQQNRTAKL